MVQGTYLDLMVLGTGMMFVLKEGVPGPVRLLLLSLCRRRVCVEVYLNHLHFFFTVSFDVQAPFDGALYGQVMMWSDSREVSYSKKVQQTYCDKMLCTLRDVSGDSLLSYSSILARSASKNVISSSLCH